MHRQYRYFADGDRDLIRVDLGDWEPGSPVFGRPAQRYLGRDSGWVESKIGHDLAVVAFDSGDYYLVSEAEAQRIMRVINAERAKLAREGRIRDWSARLRVNGGGRKGTC